MCLLQDRYHRTIRYLRLSVTELCNYRCQYCMAEEGVPKRAHEDMLSIEELAEIGEAAVRCGVTKIRLTGGEPNRFDAKVAEVIDDTFSTILMLEPEGGSARIRMELPKEEWAALRNPPVVLVGVAPEHVMTLSGEL